MIKKEFEDIIQKTRCMPFSMYLQQKQFDEHLEKYDVYEDNYYNLQLSTMLLEQAKKENEKLKYKLLPYDILESKLDCPLEVIFEAILNGVWVEVDPMDIDIENPQYMYLEEYVKLEKDSEETLCLNCYDYVDELKLSDYKKTWWLKEDKSR